jgi:hypothetical protein
MVHPIEFTTGCFVCLQPVGRPVLAPVLVLPGTRARAEVLPGVVESADGPVEVADLVFEDGSRAYGLPFACFFFVEEEELAEES